MNGKSKCKILKEIRKEIAKQNDIEFMTSECKFQGNCSGTCPKCESEVRYLEQELAKRRRAGKAVAVAGIAAAMLISAAGCRPGQQDPAQNSVSRTEEGGDRSSPDFPGEVPATYEEGIEGKIEEPLLGEPTWETTAGVPVEPLMGDVPIEVGEVPETETYG